MKATKAQVTARVEEILRIRLDGAEAWAIREYVREKQQEEGSPWQLRPEEKPLSDSQLRRYQQRADALIAESCREGRKKALRRHLAQRRALYARAVNAGDLRAALAVLRDEAELRGLYPAGKLKVKAEVGGSFHFSLEEAIAADRELEEAQRDPVQPDGGEGLLPGAAQVP
jgi:hypothetical protein